MYGNVGAYLLNGWIFSGVYRSSTIADLLLDWNYLFKGKFQRKAILSLAFGVFVYGVLG